ncbi:hypothetical protein TNCV_2247001 [Trichonephila clavipes]|nr:hypothetical protein TNCV_2247001 [Trichonephila clavipes]
MGFGNWSHGYGHLHVFGPDHSRGNGICRRKPEDSKPPVVSKSPYPPVKKIKLKTCTRLLSTNRNRASRPIVKRALGSPRHPNSIPIDTPTP